MSEEWEDAKQQYLPVLTYVAGYCCFLVIKRLQCNDCKSRITNQVGDVHSIKNSLIVSISRGSLLYPSRIAVDMIVTTYLVVNKLADTKQFQISPSQRQLIVWATMRALDQVEFMFFYEDVCVNGHEPIHVSKMIIWACTSIMLNNLCFKKNDNLIQESQAKKRKLRTLT